MGYLDDNRMNILNQQCVDRVNNKKNVVRQSLFDIITLHNNEYYEIVKDENGKHFKKRIAKKIETVQTIKANNNCQTNEYYQSTMMAQPYPAHNNQSFYQNQQVVYAQYQQLWQQQQQQIHSQFVYNNYAPQYSQYSNPTTVPINYSLTTTSNAMMTANTLYTMNMY